MVVIRRALVDRGSAALRGATLYTSGAVCDVHGRDHLVRHPPTGFCRFGAADGGKFDP
jgi:hypothetical protein